MKARAADLLPPLAFLALAVAWLWPLPAHLATALPGAPWWFDALLVNAQLQTFASNLLHDPAHLFDGLQFHPHRDVLAFTELFAVPSLLAWPVSAAAGSALAGYNTVLILGFAANGWISWLLFRRLTGERAFAALGALLVFASPYFIYQLGRLQLLLLFPLPLALLCLHRLAAEPTRWRDAAGLALAVALAWGTCVYYAVVCAPLVVLSAAILVGTRQVAAWRPFALRVGLALAAAMVAVSPMLLAYHRVSQRFGFARTLNDVQPASLRTYLHLEPGMSPFWGDLWTRPVPVAEKVLFPGVVLLLAAAACLGPWLVRAARGLPWRPWTLGGGLALAATLATHDLTWLWLAVLAACVVPPAASPRTAAQRLLLAVAACGFALSLGAHWHGWTLPLRWLFDLVPGFQAVRLVGRFGIFAIFGVAGALAVAGAGLLAARPRLRVGVAAGLALLALVELRPPGLGLIDVPPLVDDRPGFRWLRDHPGGVVLALPVRGGADVPSDGVFQDAVLTYAAACFHRHPTANGMSGFDPPAYRDVLLPTLRNYPSEAAERLLAELDVRYLYVRGELYAPARLAALLEHAAARPQALRVVHRAGRDVVLERL